MLSDMLFRLRALVRGRVVEQELDEELRAHLEHEIDKYLRGGLSRPEAVRSAHLALGGLEQVKEQCRDARGTQVIERLLNDIGYALRGIRRSPVYSLVVVSSLALGIGANTAVYSVLQALLFRSLPVSDANQLVQFVTYDQGADQHESSFSFRLYTEMQQALEPYAEVVALTPQNPTRIRIGGREPDTVLVESVTANYFAALRVSASAGRLLVASDDEDGGNPVAVISYGLWKRQLAGDPRVIGTAVRIKGNTYTVVGVAAEDFAGLEAHQRTDVWVPLKLNLPPTWLTSTGSQVLSMVGRLTKPVDRGDLESIADTVYRRHTAEHFRDDAVTRARHLQLRDARAGLSSLGFQYKKPLFILMTAVVVILLLCCANVANLLSARQEARKQEVAIRFSLGAGRARVFQQLVTEALVLGALGASAGLALAFAGSRWLMSLLPQGPVPLMIDLTPDFQVLTFTTAVGIVAALGAAVLPAIRASWINAVDG